MMGILAGQNFSAVLAGDKSIAKRTMTRVVKPLQEMGAAIDGRNNGEFAPLHIRGGTFTSNLLCFTSSECPSKVSHFTWLGYRPTAKQSLLNQKRP